jgi:hypothetical protein
VSKEVVPHLKGKVVVIHNELDPLIPPHAAIKGALEKHKASFQEYHCVALDDRAFQLAYPDFAQKPGCNGHTRGFTQAEETKVTDIIKSL